MFGLVFCVRLYYFHRLIFRCSAFNKVLQKKERVLDRGTEKKAYLLKKKRSSYLKVGEAREGGGGRDLFSFYPVLYPSGQ